MMQCNEEKGFPSLWEYEIAQGNANMVGSMIAPVEEFYKLIKTKSLISTYGEYYNPKPVTKKEWWVIRENIPDNVLKNNTPQERCALIDYILIRTDTVHQTTPNAYRLCANWELLLAEKCNGSMDSKIIPIDTLYTWVETQPEHYPNYIYGNIYNPKTVTMKQWNIIRKEIPLYALKENTYSERQNLIKYIEMIYNKCS